MKRYQIAVVINVMFFFLNTCFAHSFNHLTILTAPIGFRGEGWGGHPGVNRSLTAGLSELNIPFNFNPSKIDHVGDVVIVLTDIYALQQAIEWKRQDKIKLLLAGPNLMVRACEHNSILASPEIDWVIVPSEWVKTAYIQDVCALQDRIFVWYVGVDAQAWKPTKSKRKSRDVIIYWKAVAEGEHFYRAINKEVRDAGWNPLRLNYGGYSQDNFKKLLSQAAFAIFVSRSESQGIALAECWAMNIPTIVWNPKVLHAHERSYETVSACPYLAPENGCEWQTIEDLRDTLVSIKERLPLLHPRAWLLEHMTDAVSAQILIDFIESVL